MAFLSLLHVLYFQESGKCFLTVIIQMTEIVLKLLSAHTAQPERNARTKFSYNQLQI